MRRHLIPLLACCLLLTGAWSVLADDSAAPESIADDDSADIEAAADDLAEVLADAPLVLHTWHGLLAFLAGVVVGLCPDRIRWLLAKLAKQRRT